MFTGIVQDIGKIVEIERSGQNIQFTIATSLQEIYVDNSIAHNGICLTVESVADKQYKVTAIEETIEKTNAGYWQKGDAVNLEKPLRMNGSIDGHIVQGHVDDTAVCIQKKDRDGSVEFRFRFDKRFAALVIEKGSICVNGVSLTAFNVTQDEFTVAIIPYTFSHTNFNQLREGDFVNLEFDMLGKYVQRMMQVKA